MKVALLLIALLLSGLAIAQEVLLPEGPLVLDPRVWLMSTGALAVAVAAITAFLKVRLNLHGIATIITSFVVGIGIALAATFNLPWYGRLLGPEVTLFDALVFGASASVIASGGWDAIKGILLSVAVAKQEALVAPSRKE